MVVEDLQLVEILLFLIQWLKVLNNILSTTSRNFIIFNQLTFVTHFMS